MTATDARPDATAEALPETQWLPLLSLRAGTDDRVVVSDPLQHRRGSLPVQALLDLVAPKGTDRVPQQQGLQAELAARGWLPSGPVRPGVVRGLRLWWSRGWHPSLSYYLWSRHRTFVDESDADGDVRRDAVRRYLAEGTPDDEPARTAPDDGGVDVALPPAGALRADADLGAVLLARRTTRAYARRPVDAATLSSILAHGLADTRGNHGTKSDELAWLRSHGSCFGVYVVAYGVDGLHPGVYRYDVVTHSVRLVHAGDLRADMCSILVGMRAPETASFTLVLTADFEKYQWRYRHERALRHLYMSVGRVAQRLLIVAQAHGLGSLPTPATRDSDTCALLRLDPVRTTPLYTLTMGPLGSGTPEDTHD